MPQAIASCVRVGGVPVVAEGLLAVTIEALHGDIPRLARGERL